MKKQYFNIIFVQMKLSLDFNSEKEYLISDELYFKQMDEIIKKIDKEDYDVLIFPELSFNNKYEDYFIKNSNNRIIIFGSVYVRNEHFTIVYQNQKKYLVQKLFNSAVEPSVRFLNNLTPKEFLINYLKNHTFKLKNQKFIVLNCAEYYKTAYYIARDENKNKNLFAFIVPCANNNNQVFLNESMALHNHNENVYSFVVNSVATYKNKSYSTGGSYVFGKISSFEKENLKNYRINHSSNICFLNDECCIVKGMYLFDNSSNFYRSDNFRHTPKNFKIEKIGEI